MTAFWWILGIFLLLALLCRTQLGILLQLEEHVKLDLRLGFIRIPLIPSKESAKSEEAKAAKPKKEKKEITVQDLKEKLPKVSLQDLRETYKTLWPVCKKALRRTRQGIRIHPLQLSLILGGREEPATAAQLGGVINALVWSGMPVLEQLVQIPEPGIHVGVDFENADWQLRGAVGISLRIGTLLAVGAQLAWPSLRWLLRWMKQKKALKKTVAPPQTQESKTAA